MAPRKKRSWRTSYRDRSLIAPVMDILSAGQPTKFAFEASCRHGLRAAFCEQGEKWQWADMRAAAIVGEALRLLGAAVRPTYAEGQPSWTDPGYAPGERYFCAHCGGDMPEDRGLGAKFCSPQCKHRAYDAGARKAGVQNSRIEYLAMVTARQAQAREERGFTCESCGGKFLLKEAMRRGSRSDRYCSASCRENALTPRPCANPNCGKVFTPRRFPEAKFCCEPCMSAARRQRVKGLNGSANANGHANGSAINGNGKHSNGHGPPLEMAVDKSDLAMARKAAYSAADALPGVSAPISDQTRT